MSHPTPFGDRDTQPEGDPTSQVEPVGKGETDENQSGFVD